MVRTLSGGTVIEYSPRELGVHPNAEEPWVKVRLPGTIQFNTGAYQLLRKVSRQLGGDPEPAHVRVAIRALDEGTFGTIAPADPNLPTALSLKFPKANRTPAPVIRRLKETFQEAKIEMRPGISYKCDVSEGIDEKIGACIYFNWSEASPEPIQKRTKAPAST